jgi:hypothetical protein
LLDRERSVDCEGPVDHASFINEAFMMPPVPARSRNAITEGLPRTPKPMLRE